MANHPTSTAPDKAHAKEEASSGAAERRGLARLMSPAKLRLGLGLTGVLLVGCGVGWWFTRAPQAEPQDQLATALQQLDAGEFEEARKTVEPLIEQGYQDPEFPGSLKFIQGIATFHLADTVGAEEKAAEYQAAITLLREAEQLSLIDSRKPEWTYAVGCSLHRAGDFSPARRLLEEAYESYPIRQRETALMLTELYVQPGTRTPELLAKALELTEEVIDGAGESEKTADQARLWQCEVYLALSQMENAAEALEDLSDESTQSPAALLLKARMLLVGKKYEEAIVLLKPLCDKADLEREFAVQAGLFLGLAEEKLAQKLWQEQDQNDAEIDNHRELARGYFKRTAEQFGQTPEGTVANLRLGRLWREAGSHEKALECYGAALRMAPAEAEYRNRWLSREDFRQGVLDAWNGWLASRKHYSEAIALSEMMTPLFPKDEAYELAARVHQRWAEEIEDELRSERHSVRVARQEELRRQWRLSAEAYMRLAEVRVGTAQHADALWKAADHFHRSYEFTQALNLINQFIATKPDRLMAIALVKRGRIHLDLDQLPAAMNDLQTVMTEYPTDPSIFTTAYLIGVCHFEENRLDDAEATWRSILTSEQLSPAALEWREAQLALGRLLFQKGEVERRKAVHVQTGQGTEQTEAAYQAAQRHWEEAAALLGEYLIRNLDAEGTTEARYYLGQAYQRQAEWFHQQFQAAETDNTRLQLERQQDFVLEKSLREFETICKDLQPDASKDRLDEVQRRLLKNAVFEIPHTLFRLRRYEQAIADYNTATNRYPNDTQTLAAYIQMAQCYYHLQKPVEAGSMLATAKSMLNQKLFPNSAFEAPSTNFNRDQWREWLDRARQVQ